MELSESGEVCRLEEVTLSFNLESDKLLKKNRKEFLEEFSENIGDIINSESPEPYEANILLDTGLAFINVIPLDFSEKETNINSHILWDLSNYYPDSYKDYNVNCFRFNNQIINDYIDEVLMIAVSKLKTDFLKNICNNCNIIVKKIEIDHFAVEKYLKKMKKTLSNSLIIGFRNNRLDCSLLLDGALKYYDFEVTERNNYKVSLLRLLNVFMGKFRNLKLQEINVYGEDNITELKNFLTENIINIPELNINNVDLLYDTGIHESKYAPLYGLAISSSF